MADVIQIRRDTAANWSATNPTPAHGEPCYETDTGVLKFGDGLTAYNSLSEFGGLVDSVFGRTGAVAAATSDYNASQVDNDSGVSGADVSAALDALNSSKAAAVHTHDVAAITGVATASLLGRSTAGTGAAEEISAASARTMLNVEDGAAADQSDSEIETAYNNQVDIVSQPEAEAGTGTGVRRWTPARVKQAIEALAGAGGPSQATQAAIEAETDQDTYLPPDLMRHHPGMAKVWVRFDGTGAISINGSYNVTSLTDIGTGNYQINVADDFSGATYCVVAVAAINGARRYTDCASNSANTAGVLRVVTTTSTGTLADSDLVCAAAFGDQ